MNSKPKINRLNQRMNGICVVAFSLLITSTAQAQSQAEAIGKAVTTGNFGALQSLKASSFSMPSDERLVLTALLEADGESSKAIYEKVLSEYPGSSLADLCRTRLIEYRSATNAASPALVPPPAKPQPTRPTDVRYTLQFGSFSTKPNAQNRVQELKGKVPAKVVEVKDASGKTAYKVRWVSSTATREEIDQFVRTLPKLADDPFVVEN